jgi:fucose permease
MSAIELATSLASFWTSTGDQFRAEHPRTTDAKGNRMKEALFTMPSARVTWVATWFLVLYMGIEVALGGWIVTFMLRVRHAPAFASGMTSTGFWLGMTIGRIVLGFLTPRLGENLAILVSFPLFNPCHP